MAAMIKVLPATYAAKDERAVWNTSGVLHVLNTFSSVYGYCGVIRPSSQQDLVRMETQRIDRANPLT
jgi:hypothetical protein